MYMAVQGQGATHVNSSDEFARAAVDVDTGLGGLCRTIGMDLVLITI